MFYIHQYSCISPQETFLKNDIETLHASTENILHVIEPAYTGFPPGALRRMGKASRMGMGTAMQVLQNNAKPDGFIVGTANGGMEESIRFLKQIIEYNEDTLAPGSFVQSTANAIASQLGMSTQNHGYNITHVHKGLSFENSVIDVGMLLKENPEHSYLLGGVDEIASYNYNIEYAAGCYKKEITSNKELYNVNSSGSIAGEGAAMFLVNNTVENASAKLCALATLHTDDKRMVLDWMRSFIEKELPAGETIDLFLTGDDGDSRHAELFSSCEALVNIDTTIARFKHMCGEYPTASAFALWLACVLPVNKPLPQHMLSRKGAEQNIKNVLIYNCHQGVQHSFMLVCRAL
ncbi:MAG: beta-ketoacyl synthase chain length factor [Bacteroidota bacterium]